MLPFSFADLTDLETQGSPESLGSKIGLMIKNSSSVHARVEELTFGTGEYAVVLRGVLRRGDDPSDGGAQARRPSSGWW